MSSLDLQGFKERFQTITMMEIYSQKSVEVSTVNFCLWVILLLIETYFFCLLVDAYALDSAL